MGSVTMRLALYIIVVGLPPLLPVKLPSHPFPGTLIKLMPLVLTLKLMDKDNKLPKKPITLLPLRIFPTLMLHTKLENTSSSENTTNQLRRITSLSSMNLPSMVHATKKSPLNASMDGFSLETGPKKPTLLWKTASEQRLDVPLTGINFHKLTKRSLLLTTKLMLLTSKSLRCSLQENRS